MPRRESPSSARKTAKAQAIPQVLALRRQGESFRYIADMLGISHESARTWYKDAVTELRDDAEEEALAIKDLKQQSARRILAVIQVWHPKAITPIVDERGQPVGLDSEAAAVVLKYEERLAKLLGFDAPNRTDAKVQQQLTTDSPHGDLSNLSAADLAALEGIYARAGALRLPAADGPAT